MIRKMPIRFKELARRNIRTQRRKDFFRIKSAGTVSRIDHNLKTRERFVRVLCIRCFRDNFFSQVLGVSSD